MFKGLKSKLAEETKKLQNAVSQVAGGDGIGGFSLGKNNGALSNSGESTPQQQSQQQEQGASSTNPGFKLDECDTTAMGMLVDIPLPDGDNEMMQSPTLLAAPTPNSSSNISSSFFDPFNNNPDQSSFVPPENVVRQRRDSTGSTGSVDSFFTSTQFSTTNFAAFGNNSNRLMSTITSDMETTDNESMAGSTTFAAAASKEQISSVLSRLQGRAANYKDRYRQLAKIYNEVIRENEKIRTVLTTTQDKALRRIQELREEKRMQEKAKRELEENIRAKLTAKETMIESLRNQIRTINKEGGSADDGADAASEEKDKELAVQKERVKKLEDLLSRCKESLKAYKERIDTLSGENDGLKQKLEGLEHEEGNAAISDFVNDRVTGQYKFKMQEAEEEWQKRLAESEERTAMAVAQTKHEMHTQLEARDQTIEALREKVKQVETTASSEIEELKGKLLRAEEAEKMLDEEKKDLVEQLSRAKQAAVQIVREEENAKREQLENEWRAKLIESERNRDDQLRQADEDYQAKLAEKANEYNAKLREYEEQSQLAIEERELQKCAVATKYDERMDQLLAQIDQLKTEKLEMESNSERRAEELRSQLEGDLNSAHAAAEQQWSVRVETLERQLKESKERAERAEKNLHEEIGYLKENLAESGAKLKAAEMEHEEAVRNLRDEHEKQLSRKEEEWRTTSESSEHEKVKKYLAVIDQLRQDKLELETKANASNSEYAREIEALNSKIAQLSADVEEKSEQILLSTRRERENLELQFAADSEQRIRSEMKENHQIQLDAAKMEYEVEIRDLREEFAGKEAEWRLLQQQTTDNIDQLREGKVELERDFANRLEELRSRITADLNSRHTMEIEQANLKAAAQLSEEIEKKNEQLSSTLTDLRNAERLLADSEARMEALRAEFDQERVERERELRVKFATEYEEAVRNLRMEHETEMAGKEEEKYKEYTSLIDQLREEKCNLESKLESETARLQSQAVADLHASEEQREEELSRKEDQLKSLVEEMKKQTARHEQALKLARDEWAEKAKDYDERIALSERNWADELDVKMAEATAEHNEKVKQLCRDFQLEMSKKENEWQTELNTAYAKSEEDRHRSVREYQKEAKQIHQDLQEKTKRFNELKAAHDLIQKEKVDEVEQLRQHFGQEMIKLEEQMNHRMKQRIEDLERQHKQELDGLTTEWTTERRSVAAAVQTSRPSSPPLAAGSSSADDDDDAPLPASSVNNLELQAQIVQGDVVRQQESPMYLKQRVRQLEAQIEAIKEKQRKEMLVKGSGNALVVPPDALQTDSSANGPASSRPRMDSVSLDGASGMLFAEPTEAEYLRNILFRYMTERESLGKESVTLAKAIAAVLKFSTDQTHTVVSREEARSTSNW